LKVRVERKSQSSIANSVQLVNWRQRRMKHAGVYNGDLELDRAFDLGSKA